MRKGAFSEPGRDGVRDTLRHFVLALQGQFLAALRRDERDYVGIHPEACAGPQDAETLFDRFVSMMGGNAHADA